MARNESEFSPSIHEQQPYPAGKVFRVGEGVGTMFSTKAVIKLSNTLTTDGRQYGLVCSSRSLENCKICVASGSASKAGCEAPIKA